MNSANYPSIRTKRDFLMGKILLGSDATLAFLSIFGGDPERAMRELRMQLNPEIVQLLPNGEDGLVLMFVPNRRLNEVRRLALYTSPPYDDWRW